MYVHIYTLAIIKFYEKYCFFFYFYFHRYIYYRARIISAESVSCVRASYIRNI